MTPEEHRAAQVRAEINNLKYTHAVITSMNIERKMMGRTDDPPIKETLKQIRIRVDMLAGEQRNAT